LFPSMGRAFGWRSTSAPERHDAPRILQRIMNRQRCPTFREDVARGSSPGDCCRFAASPGKAPSLTIGPPESPCCSAKRRAVHDYCQPGLICQRGSCSHDPHDAFTCPGRIT
jgi:hypothetical protein